MELLSRKTNLPKFKSGTNVEIPYSRWYSAVSKRRSRRQFDTKPVDADTLATLSSICLEFRPTQHTRAELFDDPPESLYRGIVGPYGQIRGAPSFIAFIGDMSSPYVHEETGYTGEGIILEATALHLNTCWVGGFFNSQIATSFAGIGKKEKILAVTPVGYATEKQSIEEKLVTGFGLTHRRKKLSSMVTGLQETEWPEWVRAGIESARLAPSAINRQPWSFHVEANSIIVSVNRLGREFGIAKRLECGIAMLHIEIAAGNCGIQGEWQLLEAPAVARFSAI